MTLEHSPKEHSMNWSEFFRMGGYALYVWASYGLMAVILILNAVIPVRRHRAARRLAASFHGTSLPK